MSSAKYYTGRFLAATCMGLLMLSMPVSADELQIDYLDDDNQPQTLVVDVDATDAENSLAASLILEGSKLSVILDEKDDLELIAAAVSAMAPDTATATAISNTILGIDPVIGGLGTQPSSQAPLVAAPPVDTPPVTPPPPPPPPPSSSLPPPPSSSVVSPN